MEDALITPLPSVLRFQAGYLRSTGGFAVYQAILVAESVDDLLFCLPRKSSSPGTVASGEPLEGNSLCLAIPVRFLRLPMSSVFSFTKDSPADGDSTTDWVVVRFSDMGLWPDPTALLMVIPDAEVSGEIDAVRSAYKRRTRDRPSDSAFRTGVEYTAPA